MCHTWRSYLFQVLWKHQQVQNLKCNIQTIMWHSKLLPFLFRKKSNLEIDTRTHTHTAFWQCTQKLKLNINTLQNHMHTIFLKNSKYIHNFNTTHNSYQTLPIPKMNTQRTKITYAFFKSESRKLHTAVKVQIIRHT